MLYEQTLSGRICQVHLLLDQAPCRIRWDCLSQREQRHNFMGPELMFWRRLGWKLHQICSKSFRSVFGEKALFSKNIASSKADALQSSFTLFFCSLCGFLKLPYIQDCRFLDNIWGKWKFISFSLKRYKTCMQKNNFSRVCTTKHTIKEEIYACSQIEQNSISSSK